MSYARVDGKDTIIFMDQDATNEAAAAAPVVEEKAEEAKESAAGEQDQAAAFNPETGEINWDCPFPQWSHGGQVVEVVNFFFGTLAWFPSACTQRHIASTCTVASNTAQYYFTVLACEWNFDALTFYVLLFTTKLAITNTLQSPMTGLGGMAQGPCGEDFKKSFSCFVYSEAEPKGVDCVENFRAMQDCFRQHPDIYGNEIDDDDDEEEAEVKAETTEKVEA